MTRFTQTERIVRNHMLYICIKLQVIEKYFSFLISLLSTH